MSGAATGEETTDDGFLDGRLKILQPAKGYRAGLDAVLLAAAVPAREGERALEAGAGVGVASLCLASRVSGLEVAGIELQPELVRLATANITRNGLGERVSVAEGDIGHPVRDLAAMGLEPNSWHHVFANPPFHDPAASPASPNASKAQAHLTLGSDLDDWVRFACKAASRVIVRGQRGSRAPLTLRPGLVLHGRDGRFTERTEALLRRGEALLLDQPA